jgi:hypothetical protein
VIADFRDLLAALTDTGVRFLVVDAHALAAHGVPRMTSGMTSRHLLTSPPRSWRKGTFVLLLCCSVSGCAGTPAPTTTAEPVVMHRAFEASSERYKAGVRGSLYGHLQLEHDLLTVVVERGDVFSYTRLSRTQLTIGIRACPTRDHQPSGIKRTSWRTTNRLRSEPVSLGPALAGERRQLTDSIVLTLQLPRGIDLKLHELRFDLRGELPQGNPASTTGGQIHEELALDGNALPPDCELGRDLWGRGPLPDTAAHFIPPIPPLRQP